MDSHTLTRTHTHTPPCCSESCHVDGLVASPTGSPRPLTRQDSLSLSPKRKSNVSPENVESRLFGLQRWLWRGEEEGRGGGFGASRLRTVKRRFFSWIEREKSEKAGVKGGREGFNPSASAIVVKPLPRGALPGGSLRPVHPTLRVCFVYPVRSVSHPGLCVCVCVQPSH